jgi:hypothetical protein
MFRLELRHDLLRVLARNVLHFHVLLLSKQILGEFHLLEHVVQLPQVQVSSCGYFNALRFLERRCYADVLAVRFYPRIVADVLLGIRPLPHHVHRLDLWELHSVAQAPWRSYDPKSAVQVG